VFHGRWVELKSRWRFPRFRGLAVRVAVTWGAAVFISGALVRELLLGKIEPEEVGYAEASVGGVFFLAVLVTVLAWVFARDYGPHESRR